MPRKRYPTIKQGSDGLWHAWVSVGTKPNGRPDQRHVKRATEAEAEERVDELLAQKKTGAVVKGGRVGTTGQWLLTYLDTVLPSSGRCDPDTVRDYRSLIEHWALPVIGSIRRDRLQTANLEEVYLGMRRGGKADSTIVKMHRVLSRALEVAFRRGLVPRNVAKLMDAPTSKRIEQNVLSMEDAGAVLAAAGARRTKARWSIGLGLGLRQGEALGLRWQYLDLDRGEMRVWWQVSRRMFEHGCDGTCGRRKAGYCPQRYLPLRSGETAVLDLSKPATGDRRTGLVLKEPKGTSKRTVPLPDELIDELKEHRSAQLVERALAGAAWQDHGFVFPTEVGLPIDPKVDYREWRDLLDESGVPAAKLHDGRHTAATILILLGVPIEIVQEILGHSDVRVTRGYVHVASEMAKAATQRMGRALLKRAVHPEQHP